jgi:hypothetical protein
VTEFDSEINILEIPGHCEWKLLFQGRGGGGEELKRGNSECSDVFFTLGLKFYSSTSRLKKKNLNIYSIYKSENPFLNLLFGLENTQRSEANISLGYSEKVIILIQFSISHVPNCVNKHLKMSTQY